MERLRAAHTALGREKAERDVELGEALTKVPDAPYAVYAVSQHGVFERQRNHRRACPDGFAVQSAGPVSHLLNCERRRQLLPCGQLCSECSECRAPTLLQVAALEDKVAGQRGLVAEQGQRIKEMEVGHRAACHREGLGREMAVTAGTARGRSTR